MLFDLHTYLSSRVIALCALALGSSVAGAAWADEAPGGFIEPSTTLEARPLLRPNEIAAFLPERGAFDFPEPYGTRGVRITNASDCNGNDCVNYVAYAYWRNINNHVGSDEMLIFLGLNAARGGEGPTLFRYNKVTEEMSKVGPLFDYGSQLSWATAEGWYFSATQPTTIYLNQGSRMMRYDVIERTFETVVDVTDHAGAGHYVWQMHSSNDDRTHSATLRRRSDDADLGCFVYQEDGGNYHFFPRQGGYDECQIDRSGRWLLIKENLGGRFTDSRIIDLETGRERVHLNADGGGGHSDMGYGAVVKADHMDREANAWKVWDFTQSTLSGTRVYYNANWDAFRPNHISFSHARADVPLNEQYVCGSQANRTNAPQANEIICFMLDESRDVLVVAPVMTDMDAQGGLHDYGKLPKGNLDVTGQYFIWTSNMGGNRLDAFLVRVPSQVLTGESAPTPSDPIVDPDPIEEPGDEPDPIEDPVPSDPNGHDAVWTKLVNVTADGNSLVKSSGCDGCPDATATTEQRIDQVGGYIEWVASELNTLRTVGLSSSGSSGSQIDFAIRMQSGNAEVRERGNYRANARFASGDVLRIAVEADGVKYYRNGTVFHTSSAVPVLPLHAHALLYDGGATIKDVVVATTVDDDGEGGVEPGPEPDPEPSVPVTAEVVWTGAVNVTVDGNSLTKTGGCNGCADAGAVSSRAIDATNGWVEFTASERNTLRALGLSSATEVSGASSLDFAIRLQSGNAEVRENGRYRANTRFRQGDVLRISIEDGRVRYAKNGTVFHTSSSTATRPLRAHALLYDPGATIRNVRIAANGSAADGGEGDKEPAPEPEPSTPKQITAGVAWTAAVNVTVRGNSLTKTGGCNGCPDAGAVSSRIIDEAGGGVEFTASERNTLRALGLSSATEVSGASSLDFAIRLQSGNAEVRENGRYRANTRFRQGDVLRISIEDGRVRYAKNGTVFYTSSSTASRPLRAHALLYDSGATVENVVLTNWEK